MESLIRLGALRRVPTAFIASHHSTEASERAEAGWGMCGVLAGAAAVHGVGYHDHNWGVGQGTPGGGAAQLSGGGLGALFDHWYWGRLYLPAHTLVYTVGRAPEALGKFPILSLVALRGEVAGHVFRAGRLRRERPEG